jgi:hypothetical protein
MHGANLLNSGWYALKGIVSPTDSIFRRLIQKSHRIFMITAMGDAGQMGQV